MMYRLLITFFGAFPAAEVPARGTGRTFPAGETCQKFALGDVVGRWQDMLGPDVLPGWGFCRLFAYWFSASNFFRNSTRASTPSLGMAL